ncbi:MAG: tyrosine--tRNA ligase [Candidatus Omnitrophica bacterium]|nr:tyrosine--tRNA ligase [Candidatus Omnitrophota bacterium]
MDIQNQLQIIKRGTVEMISEEELVKKLERKKALVVKAGFDPSAPDIHLGHTVLLRKLRHFQELGHKVVFLIGDFTGMIGDPTGRSEIRKRLTEKEVKENAKTYKKQVFKVLDEKKTKVVFNSEWLKSFTLKDALELTSHSTVSQLLARQDFNERYKSGKDISLLEFMYPLLQAYDSVYLKADVELGGTDQKFNLLLGREFQRDYSQESQVIIMMPLLIGLDGTQKMSKSFGNHIGIDEKPEEMFGKIMSVSDELMLQYYELLTDEDLDNVRAMHPMEAKKKLAEDIVGQYHGKKSAQAAKQDFENKFQKRDPFTELKVETKPFKATLCEFLVYDKICSSKGEYKRLVEQSAIEVDGKRIKDAEFKLEPDKEYRIKIGKKRFLKVKLKS